MFLKSFCRAESQFPLGCYPWKTQVLPLGVLQGNPPSAVPSPAVVWGAGVPAAPRGSSRSGCSSCWQRWLGGAWCEQHARMAMLNEATLRLSFICIVPWINVASCVKETTVSVL